MILSCFTLSIKQCLKSEMPVVGGSKGRPRSNDTPWLRSSIQFGNNGRKLRKEAGGGGHNMPKIVPWHLCGIVITLAMAAAPRLARQSHSTSIGHKVWCQTSQMGMIATIIIAHPAMIKRLRLGGHCPPPAHGSFRWPTGKKDICLAI